MTKVTYVGDEAYIVEGGIEFIRGKATEVDDDHVRLAKLAKNPQFEVGGKAPTTAQVPIFAGPTEIDKIKGRLTEKSVKFHHSHGLAKLQELEADHDAKAAASIGTAG